MRYDLIVFDLDGTLIDSMDDLASSLRRALAKHGRPDVTRQKVADSVGRGTPKLIASTTHPPYEPVLKTFLEDYEEHLLDQTKLYPGVEETLSALEVRKLVLSNKYEGFSRKILEGLGAARHFEAIYGSDSFNVRKPDPAGLRAAVGSARRILFVGDSAVDVQTARNAGVESCAVTYGYAKPGDLDDADYRIDRFELLLERVR